MSVEDQKREKEFSRNCELESLLSEMAELLCPANGKLVKASCDEKFSKIFIVGPLRSGTTLFTQWLAGSGLSAYPTNLLSRFFGAPSVGAKIQQLLTDPRYNFRNEILDFNSNINFVSENGKTKGALSPNEFWYFWRRFIPFDELDYMPSDELFQKADMTGFRDELNALANIFCKPFAMKAMILNQNIPDLASLFEKVLFIQIKRDPVFNIQSALEARKRQCGDISTWYSFKIKEYTELKLLNPLEAVAGQIAATNRAVDQGISGLPEQNKLVIHYEDFCRRPEYYFDEIVHRLIQQGGIIESDIPSYRGENGFSNTNVWKMAEYSKDEAVIAYQNMSAVYT